MTLPTAAAGAALLQLLLVFAPLRAEPTIPGDWQLAWQDEFDCGAVPSAPDARNWSYEIGYVRNREWQYYTDDLQNAYCQNGTLHVEAHQHPAGTYPAGAYANQDGRLSSASLISRDKIELRYGYIEIRARIDTRLGSWPAFWTLGASGEWPDNGETDIIEFYRNQLLFNVAWWKSGDARWQARWDSVRVNLSTLPPGWASEFHVWAMSWDPDGVRLYLDGMLYNSWDSAVDSGDGSLEGFQQPHFMIINQAIGGNSGGNASGLVYPTSYEVDWVRWYQELSLPAGIVDDNDTAVSYSGTWGIWEGNPGYQATEHFSETAGSAATFSFTGSRARYYGAMRNDLGQAEIYVDGVYQATIDAYAVGPRYNVMLYETPELANGPHTLRIVVSGNSNPASSGFEIIVDAFEFFEGVATAEQVPLVPPLAAAVLTVLIAGAASRRALPGRLPGTVY